MTSPIPALILIACIALGLLWAAWKRSRIVEPSDPTEPHGDVVNVPRAMKRGGW